MRDWNWYLCRRLSATAVASYVGTAAVAIWAAATVGLAVTAGVKGQAHRVSLWPDWADLGLSDLSQLIDICAIIPIIATAFTCQVSGNGAAVQHLVAHAAMHGAGPVPGES